MAFHCANARFSCKGYRSQSSIFNSDAFCCVCGRSNKDDTNHMIECSQCFIKVRTGNHIIVYYFFVLIIYNFTFHVLILCRFTRLVMGF